MNILVTGGAGYIGSHVVKQLLEESSHTIVVIDNLSTGFHYTIEQLKLIGHFMFIEMDLKDFEQIAYLLKEYSIDTIMHFAASSIVSESMQNPLKYYINNTLNTTQLINSAIKCGVKQFIFSSTAAVYGEPDTLEGIDESFSISPINPYGMSKLMSEEILQDAAKTSNDLKYVIFRYFNVAGADMHYHDSVLSPRIGEDHEPETHLIPLIAQTAMGKRENIAIYGEDYNTQDGTCIRDYIHVDDVANAHIKAIEYLKIHSSEIFNIGYGEGYSVKEVVKSMQQVSRVDFKVKMADRRVGDPAILIANNYKIATKMGWKPQYNNIKLLCQSALSWENLKMERV